MKKPWDRKKYLIGQLRQASYRYPARSAAFKRVFIETGWYMCEGCHRAFPRNKVVADHIQPVVDPTVGWVDWNTFIDRLFCDESNYQILCRPCHTAKSTEENSLRRKAKKSDEMDA